MLEVTKQWLELPDYDAALHLNQAFIKGERRCNIGHRGPLDPETKPLIPGLLRLHEYGLLTYDSQPFRPQERISLKEKGGWWQEIRQRPYLRFLVPGRDRIPLVAITAFTSFLFADAAIVTHVVHPDAGKTYGTNIDDRHATTESKFAFSLEQLEKMDMTVSASVQAVYRHSTDDWARVRALGLARCFDISVASRSWDQDLDLLQVVEDIAIKAGIERYYPHDTPSIKASIDIKEETANEEGGAIEKENAPKKKPASKKGTAIKKEEH
ncbi:MAG: hypothetical protein Q9168_007751 [Polycauliona sp. 1 TL-2023]